MPERKKYVGNFQMDFAEMEFVNGRTMKRYVGEFKNGLLA